MAPISAPPSLKSGSIQSGLPEWARQLSSVRPGMLGRKRNGSLPLGCSALQLSIFRVCSFVNPATFHLVSPARPHSISLHGVTSVEGTIALCVHSCSLGAQSPGSAVCSQGMAG